MLLYDITRGVDVATKHDIYELMVGLLGEGKALLFYSSETEETAHLCHRVIVDPRGQGRGRARRARRPTRRRSSQRR